MVPSLDITLWKYKIGLKNRNHILTLKVFPVSLCAHSQCLEGCLGLAANWILTQLYSVLFEKANNGVFAVKLFLTSFLRFWLGPLPISYHICQWNPLPQGIEVPFFMRKVHRGVFPRSLS